jgi:hypothetical protein
VGIKIFEIDRISFVVNINNQTIAISLDIKNSEIAHRFRISIDLFYRKAAVKPLASAMGI